MKLLFSIIFSLSVISSFSQDKQIRKSKRLFEKGKYEKCIIKTKKYLKKYRRNPDLQFYIVQSQLAIYQEEIDRDKLNQLKKVIKSYKILILYSNNKQGFSSLNKHVISLVFFELENPNISHDNIDYLNVCLAQNFGDTTEYYKKKYVKNPTQETIKENIGPVFDTLIHLDSLRRSLLVSAKSQIGVPYEYGGADSTGFDCSGFTQFLYQGIGIKLPHNAQLQSELGALIQLEDAQTGDLIFFGERRAAHAGMIYINNNGEVELIHCVSRGVSYDTEEDNNHMYWMNRPYRIKRFLGFDSLTQNE